MHVLPSYAEASYSLLDLAGAGSRIAPFVPYQYMNLNTDTTVIELGFGLIY